MGRRDRERKSRIQAGEEKGMREIKGAGLKHRLGVVESEDGSWTALDGKMGGNSWAWASRQLPSLEREIIGNETR